MVRGYPFPPRLVDRDLLFELVAIHTPRDRQVSAARRRPDTCPTGDTFRANRVSIGADVFGSGLSAEIGAVVGWRAANIVPGARWPVKIAYTQQPKLDPVSALPSPKADPAVSAFVPWCAQRIMPAVRSNAPAVELFVVDSDRRAIDSCIKDSTIDTAFIVECGKRKSTGQLKRIGNVDIGAPVLYSPVEEFCPTHE
jgi:hypothetical protein